MATGNDAYKEAVGVAAAQLVEQGMVLGLGTGTTAAFLVRALAERMRQGLQIRMAVATSEATAQLARSLGIPLGSLDEYPVLDLAIDGADEVDPGLNLIKGGGGALLREKIVASAAREFVVIGDISKQVPRLGTHAVLPVEVVPFAQGPVRRRLEVLGALVAARMRDGKLFITDNQNAVLDCTFPQGIQDPFALQDEIRKIVGVVEHGLFLGMARRVLLAGPDGLVQLP